ncbi:hypothetical protein V8E53_006715 [Lactarius tabidus]
MVSLPTIQHLSNTYPGSHHLILAVIFIMKLASVLRCFGISRHSVLALAELNYQEAGIDLKIQEYLAGTSEEQSVEQLADFIMATDIAPSQGLIMRKEFKPCYKKLWESINPTSQATSSGQEIV